MEGGGGVVQKGGNRDQNWIEKVAVLGIRIRKIPMFLGLPDPDPLIRGMDPDPALDPSIIKQR
jgi:hypothetical protein